MPAEQPSRMVRPIPDYPTPDGRHRTPRVAVAAALLTVGALAGWLAGSAVDTASPSATTQPVAGGLPITTEPPAVISWREAGSIPALPDGFSLSGGYDAAELDGEIYLAVNLSNESGVARSMLWRSADGVTWDDTGLDLGEPAAISRLLAYEEGLLLVGAKASEAGAPEPAAAPTVWRSLPGRTIDADSWVEITLGSSGMTPYSVTAAVNDSGNVAVAAEGTIDLTAAVIDPLLPPGFSAADSDVYLTGTAVVVDPDTTDGQSDVIAQFADFPALTVVGDRAWSRVVGLDGEETMATHPLPAAGHYRQGVQNSLYVDTVMVWRSTDGTEFRQVGTTLIPDGFFLAERWQDRFVAAAYERQDSFAQNETVTIWESRRGTAWHPLDEQPPAQCSPFFFAASGSRLLALSETGPICIRNGAADWVTLEVDRPPAGNLVGGDAGFALIPFDSQISPPQFSPDGINWVDIELPEDSLHPQVVVLPDRLLMTTVYVDPFAPPEPRIWIGELG